MVFDFNIDLSQPRKAATKPGWPGDWRAGSQAVHQKPQPSGLKKNRSGFGQAQPVVERESDEEEEPVPAPVVADVAASEVTADSNGESRHFVWDASKGALVPAQSTKAEDAAKEVTPTQDVANVVEQKETETQLQGNIQKEADTGEEAQGDEDGEESGEEEEPEQDIEAESRSAFITSASTPELIRQAVSLGGNLADATSDRWVFDKGTELHFKYDTPTSKIYCWNPGQGCMYHWRERGKMNFLWASPSGPSTTPPPGFPMSAVTAFASTVTTSSSSTATPTRPADHPTSSLWVTVIPPQVLVAGGIEDPHTKVEEEVELSEKALKAVIGKGGSSIKEIEKHSGVVATALEPKEGDPPHIRKLRLQGSRAAIASAKAALEQRVVLVLGHKAAEKMQKHLSQQLLEKKRAETGSDAAKTGVRGLSDFAQEHKIKAVMARKVSRLDAMLQRYLIRHFEPKKAKPANALKGYLIALLRQPQKWRLEALYEDGELDGEICETVPILEGGAVVGCDHAAQGDNEQVIELEVNSALSEREAAKIYGDVRPQHCKVLRMGQDYYAMALESQIGTLVDGHKFRQHDGPVPISDGSVLGVGKYLLYCEVGTDVSLQERRKRLLQGERFWQEGNDAVHRAEQQAADEAQAAREAAEDYAAVNSIRAAISAADGESLPQVPEEESDEEDELDAMLQTFEADVNSRKRKRDAEDDPQEEAAPQEVTDPQEEAGLHNES